jgi:hypothetical protein
MASIFEVAGGIKVFWFFSSEKNMFPPVTARLLAAWLYPTRQHGGERDAAGDRSGFSHGTGQADRVLGPHRA